MMPDSRACPHCGKVNDRHAGLTGADRPKPGDVMICWTCKKPAFFTEDGVRKPTVKERVELDADMRLKHALHAALVAQTPAEAIQMSNEGL